MPLKSRIVVHGNGDDEKDMVRRDCDCAFADKAIVRLMLSLEMCLGFSFGTADVKGAYVQSGAISREVYVRPLRDCYRRRGMIWRLLKLPYGMVDDGRQCMLEAEEWMVKG